VPVEQAIVRLQKTSAALGRSVQTLKDDDTAVLAARERRWADAGRPLAYVGVLFMVAALAANGRWGWRQTGVQLRPGEPAPIGPDGTHRVVLADVAAQGTHADVQVDGGGVVHVTRDQAVRRWGYQFQLTDVSGPLVSVSSHRDAGTPIALSAYGARPDTVQTLDLAFSRTDGDTDAGRLFIVPADKLVVRVQWTNPRETAQGQPARFRQWVFEQGGQALVGEAEFDSASAQTVVGSVTYDWRVSTYVVLEIAYQPGGWVLALSALCVAAGLIVEAVPRSVVWARVDGQEEATVVIWQTVRGVSQRASQLRETFVQVLEQVEVK
jgi:hypothetical protein